MEIIIRCDVCEESLKVISTVIESGELVIRVKPCEDHVSSESKNELIDSIIDKLKDMKTEEE